MASGRQDSRIADAPVPPPAAVAHRAPQFAKLAALIRRSQDDRDSGADELHFAHDRTCDDARPRDAPGAAYRAPPTMDATCLARFAGSLRGAAGQRTQRTQAPVK
ncbi:MAG TPA: hypothetical protein VMT03_21705 [Polyangia bacterium]|nr:hypothetical protein [Polyangia bacterium]